MKKMFFIAICAMFLLSCGESVQEAPAEEKPAVATPNYVYPVEYSAQFELSDPKRAELVLQLWKDYDSNSMDGGRVHFADSLRVEVGGSVMEGQTDSVLANLKAYRSGFSSVSSSVEAVMSLRSTDKNEDFVLVWGRETSTTNAGKTDSTRLHEIWRFNKDGKADYMRQYLTPIPAN